MAEFVLGARLHDYGKGTPESLFAAVSADGYRAVQLAYKKCIDSVRTYDDITPELVKQTVDAGKAHDIWVAVLGMYVELALADDVQRQKNTKDFIAQLLVAKALGAGCIGCETTNMDKQPAGFTREQAQYQLCKSLECILPQAEALGVIVAIEPVSYHSVHTPEAALNILNTLRSPNLKIIFDAGNLLTANEVDRQAQLWDRVGNLLGDKLVAVHFKGEAFRPDGSFYATSLEDSVIDFASAFSMLRALPQRLPVLREQAVPERAASDIAWMQKFFTE